MADYWHTEGKVVSAGPWRCSIYLDRLCRLCFSQSSQDFQDIFDIVLASLCLFVSARGGEGICESIEIPTSWFMYSIGSEQTETYLMGICSQCVFGFVLAFT